MEPLQAPSLRQKTSNKYTSVTLTRIFFTYLLKCFLGSGSGSIGFGTQFYAKLTYRELGSSHERPIQTDVHGKVRDATSRNIIDGGNDVLRGNWPPQTPPERCAANFRIFWRAVQLPIICLSPNGEQNVVRSRSQNDNKLNCQGGKGMPDMQKHHM